ncbi:MAG: toxin-antitoxin system, antitoxin component, Xre family protein [Steroidobacteraceae bacterium]
MGALAEHLLLEKLRDLPPERRAEVEDFIDFLQNLEADQSLARSATQTSEPAFKAVWDNPDDAEYDRL